MISAMKAACFIVNYDNKMKYYTMSVYKLQKVLFLAQMFFVKYSASHSFCFSEDIEAREYGPVVPSVYDTMKYFGNNIIPPVKFFWEPKENRLCKIEYNDTLIPDEDQKLLRKLVDKCAPYTPTEMYDICCRNFPVWKKARYSIKRIVSKEDLRNFAMSL